MTIYIIDRGRAQTGIDRFALIILRDGDELPLEPGWSIHWQGTDIAQAREAINRMRQSATY